MAAKARLVRQIRATMETRSLSQTAAAKLMGIDQPTLSKLLRGVVRNVTFDRLSLMLRRLGRNVTIIVEPDTILEEPAGERALGHVVVREDTIVLLA
jgi:predicted XRE-type DNA-binding protein